ncbi:EamA family transporter [Streptomyces sp. SB3404]|uniref:EamA family transporter n=1 Tax=Streptomyces boncukensis TaxID=2711219 RepID=A0A6G4WWQ2_9ACTN|nr:EamA family transporter [Streptomyces boncukensis]
MSSEISAPSLGAARAAAGPLFVLAAAVLWGTTGTAADFAPAGVSPLAVGAATIGIGGLLTLLLGGRPALAVPRGGPGTLPRLLLGGLAVAVYPLAFYSAMARAGVAVGTVVTIGSAPVFAALLERGLDGTRLTRRWAAATVCAALGCAALVLTGGEAEATGTGTAPDPAAGIALGLLAGAGYAGYAYCGSGLIRRGHRARAAMGALFGLGSLLLLPVLAVTGGPLLLSGARGLAVAGYLAAVPMCLAYVLFGAGLARTSPSAATTLSLLESVVAALLGVAVVGERLDARAWGGLALVLAGLLLVTLPARSAARGRADP